MIRWEPDAPSPRRGEWVWQFDDLRCEPGDSVSRAQFDVLLTGLGANLALHPEGLTEDALADVSQYVLRLSGAVIGDRSSLQAYGLLAGRSGPAGRA